MVGEASGNVREVFEEKGSEEGTTVLFAEDFRPLQVCNYNDEGGFDCSSPICGEFHCQLSGDYQMKNINTVLAAIYEMRRIGIEISDEAVAAGMNAVCELTGLAGRWMRLADNPLTICDTGHNEAGIRHTMRQLERSATKRKGRKHIVIGFVADKAIDEIIGLLPADATYYLTQAAIPRALSAADLRAKFMQHGIDGETYPTPKEAADAARCAAREEDVIYIGGSTFVVADYLKQTCF